MGIRYMQGTCVGDTNSEITKEYLEKKYYDKDEIDEGKEELTETLQTAIDKEATTRQEEDEAIQETLNSHTSRLDVDEANITTLFTRTNIIVLTDEELANAQLSDEHFEIISNNHNVNVQATMNGATFLLKFECQNENALVYTCNYSTGDSTTAIIEVVMNATTGQFTYSDSEIGDLSNYYTKSEVDSELSTRDSEIATNKESISTLNSKALKTLDSAPTDTQLVGIDSDNAQSMVEIGDGLQIVDKKLSTTAASTHLYEYKVYVATTSDNTAFYFKFLSTDSTLDFTGTDLSTVYNWLVDNGYCDTSTNATSLRTLTAGQWKDMNGRWQDNSYHIYAVVAITDSEYLRVFNAYNVYFSWSITETNWTIKQEVKQIF